MAEWDPAVAYSPGDIVTYRGQAYLRSQYPVTPTSGTPPNVELGTDPKGDAIRSWELSTPSYQTKFVFHPFHFRVIHPPMNSAQPNPVIQYGEESDYAENAYGPVYGQGGLNDIGKRGYTVEYGQAKPATPTSPAVAECPGAYCGVGLQQIQEIQSYDPPVIPGPDVGFSWVIDAFHDLIPNPNPAFPGQYIEDPTATHPYKWYLFFRFNHPLLFRRNCTITLQFLKTYTPLDPPDVPQYSYVYVNDSNVPTDKNYTSYTNFSYVTQPPGAGAYYIAPSNAFLTIDEPDPENEPAFTISYQLVSVYLNIAEPNW